MYEESSNGEDERLAALLRFEILDSEPEEAFDRITRLTRAVLQMPMSLVNLVDKDRQYFLSRQGVDEREVPRRDNSFCVHAIRQAEPLVVQDTLKDPRFVENPRVIGKPNVRCYVGVPLRSREGHNIGTLCSMDTKPRQFTAEQVEILRGFAQLVVDELELRLQANVDPLTGTLTRRCFDREMKRAIDSAKRNGRDLSVALVDIDHFKQVNDSYGHSTGDFALQRVAAVLKSELNDSEFIGRLGGEEFAILLPDANATSAMRFAEHLRKSVAELVLKTSGGTIAVTVSIGVATFDAEETAANLLERADAATYRAKAAGRNRTIAACPPQARSGAAA